MPNVVAVFRDTRLNGVKDTMWHQNGRSFRQRHYLLSNECVKASRLNDRELIMPGQCTEKVQQLYIAPQTAYMSPHRRRASHTGLQFSPSPHSRTLACSHTVI